MYTGGNEITRPYGRNVDMMGRYAVELDGTRTFHRADPWGGSYHGYPSYWERKHLDACIAMEHDFFGEFGMASMPVHESVLRYLPKAEQTRWPPKLDGALNFHVPTFNRDSLDRITQYAALFAPVDTCGWSGSSRPRRWPRWSVCATLSNGRARVGRTAPARFTTR